jgi:hypothetical protein
MMAAMSVLRERESAMFADARGAGRTLRVSWHDQGAGLVVLSLWRDGTCTASFRLARDDVGAFADVLLRGLAAGRGRADGPATGSEPVRTGAIDPTVRQADDPYVATRAPDYAAPDEQPSTQQEPDEPASAQEDTAELAQPSLADWIFSGRAAG